MPRRPFGSRIDRAVRLSAGTDSGPGPTRYPKHGPHGGGPAATPALTRGGRSRDDFGRRPHSGCRGGRSARESTGRCAGQRAPIPGRVRRVTRNTALTGGGPAAAPRPLPAAAVLVMTSVGDRTADPRPPFGSRLPRTARVSGRPSPGPAPPRPPKPRPHGAAPAPTPAPPRGGRSRYDLGRRPRGGCRGGRSARESTGRRACQGAPIPGRVRRV